MPPKSFDGEKISGKSGSVHMDMIRVLDKEVGRIVQALKDSGAYDNTLIIFTSDNGGLGTQATRRTGHDPSGGWRGQKNDAWEGGHRVPFVAVWPGHIKAGSISDEKMVNHDSLATVAAAVGFQLQPQQAMDSLNLLPLLTGKGEFVQRGSLLLQAGSRQQVILRDGDWKLIMQSDRQTTKWDPIALFNLAENPSESEGENLVNDKDHTQRVASMREAYLAIRQSGSRTTPL